MKATAANIAKLQARWAKEDAGKTMTEAARAELWAAKGAQAVAAQKTSTDKSRTRKLGYFGEEV